MFLDKKTEEILGMDAVWGMLDVKSPFGKEIVSSREYYTDKNALIEKYKELGIMLKLMKKEGIKVEYSRKLLSYLRDIRTTVKRLSEGKLLNDLELFELKYFLYYQKRLAKEWKILGNFEEAWKILAITGKENYDFYFEDEYSAKLSGLRKRIKALTGKKAEEEAKFFKKLGVKPNDRFVVSKNDNSLLQKFERAKEMRKVKETFSSVLFEFSKTGKILEIEKEIEALLNEKSGEKEKVRKWIAKELEPFAPKLLDEFSKIGNLDFVMAKAILCNKINCLEPKFGKGIEVKEGCHFIFSNELSLKNLKYTPLSIAINKGVSVITGSNMAGKTQTLRGLGFLAAMAQAGFFVPAKNFAFFPFNFIFFSTEEPSTEAGFSTFAKEVIRVGEILGKADTSGLILIDEIAKGTNNTEAQALSYAIIEELRKSNSFSIVTTHLPGLLNIPKVSYFRMKGLKLPKGIMENDINLLYKYMDYTIEQGSKAIPMDAIKIAEIMGLKKEVVERAKELLGSRKRM